MANSSSSSGVGFFGLLAVALIVLKLTGVIPISWWWIVFIWLMPAILVVLILGIVIILDWWSKR